MLLGIALTQCLLSLQFEDCTFDWLYWSQAREPYSPDRVDYIKSLDAEKDTILLKKGVDRGLTPYEIGSIMSRENLNKESVIDEIICEVQESLLPGMEEYVFLESVSQIMDSRLISFQNRLSGIPSYII